MLASVAVALVLSSPVPLPKPVLAPPPAPARQQAPIAESVASEAATAAPAARQAEAVPVPVPRPEVATAAADLTGTRKTAPAKPAAAVPRPAERPGGDAPVVRAMLPGGSAPGVVPRGMVCRDPRILGEPAASFVGNIPGCGIPDPVRVASISGVRLSGPITVDCRTARAVADWVSGVAQPAARETLGSGIASLSVMGSYSCRTRNNRPGERLSEHSVGRAVDIGGVRLADGRQISVRDHWDMGAPGAFLRRAWKGACGRFTTVIGPDGDRHHRDHLHLDTAYRDSTWCR